MKPLICIPMGDPAGIGPEIIVKALSTCDFSNTCRLLVVGYSDIIQQANAFCHNALKIQRIRSVKDINQKPDTIHILEPECSSLTFESGIVSAGAGTMAYHCILQSVKLAMAQQVDALATTPINKMSLNAAGIKQAGHTEILAELTDTQDPLTLFQVANLKVFFLSRHLSLRSACDYVTTSNVIQCAKKAITALKNLGVESPHLAIAGLNPHCGDNGLFGSEENKEIEPAVHQLQAMGLNVSGPLPADSVFYQALNGKFDAVLSLYHDQGHIATKMVDFHRTISITCGLPFLRTSVDHGTAYDIAGKGIASAISMIEAIKVAASYMTRFDIY